MSSQGVSAVLWVRYGFALLVVLTLVSCSLARSVPEATKENEVVSAWEKLVAVLAAKGLTPQQIGVGRPVHIPDPSASGRSIDAGLVEGQDTGEAEVEEALKAYMKACYNSGYYPSSTSSYTSYSRPSSGYTSYSRPSSGYTSYSRPSSGYTSGNTLGGYGGGYSGGYSNTGYNVVPYSNGYTGVNTGTNGYNNGFTGGYYVPNTGINTGYTGYYNGGSTGLSSGYIRPYTGR